MRYLIAFILEIEQTKNYLDILICEMFSHSTYISFSIAVCLVHIQYQTEKKLKYRFHAQMTTEQYRSEDSHS